MPSGEVVPVTSAPSGLVKCKSVMVPWATLIVSGTTGERSVAPKAGLADTTATGGRTVGVGGAVVLGDVDPPDDAEVGGDADEVLAMPDALAVSAPFAPANDVIGVADPVHPASSAAAAIARAVNAVRRTAVIPVHPTMSPVRSPGCAFWAGIRCPNRR